MDKWFGGKPGFGWYAPGPGDPTPEPSDDPDYYTLDGNEIQVMWDYGVTVPLWNDGLLPDDPDWLRRALGLSDSMIERLTRWGEAMNAQDALPDPASPERRAARENLRRLGGVLADDLQRELGPRYTITYRWW